MEKWIALVVVIVIVVMNRLIIYSAKKDIRSMEDIDFDLSVASYKPKITEGKTKVKLLNIGADKEATLATINRYNKEADESIAVGDIILENVGVYTAEDLIYELKYIGADAEIIN